MVESFEDSVRVRVVEDLGVVVAGAECFFHAPCGSYCFVVAFSLHASACVYD